LSLAITAVVVPPLGPERRRRYSRLAVWVGSGLGSPLAGGVLGPDATAPARTLRMEVDDKELGPPPPAVAAARVGPRTPPPAQHRELVAQDEDLQIPGGVAAGDRASIWMKRRRQVGGSRQHQVAFVVGSSVTVPNRVSMRTSSSQATSEFPHPTGVAGRPRAGSRCADGRAMCWPPGLDAARRAPATQGRGLLACRVPP
jgi:hypothetical protein